MTFCGLFLFAIKLCEYKKMASYTSNGEKMRASKHEKKREVENDADEKVNSIIPLCGVNTVVISGTLNIPSAWQFNYARLR